MTESQVALLVVATARRLGFEAGLRPSYSSKPSKTQHVTIRHAHGVLKVRVSDHKQTRLSCELYGRPGLDFVGMEPGRIEAVLVGRLANLSKVEGATVRALPDWFVQAKPATPLRVQA